MFCPHCRDEYNEGIEICAECGARLVYELEDTGRESEKNDREFDTCGIIYNPVRIKKYGTIEEAYMIQGYLNNIGIPCKLIDKTMQVLGLNILFELVVDEEDRDEVGRLLDTLDSNTPPPDDQETGSYGFT